jgi:hypothetical protein
MEVEYIRLKKPVTFSGSSVMGFGIRCQECYRLSGTTILFRLSKNFRKRLNPKVFLYDIVKNGCPYSTLQNEDQIEEVLWRKRIQDKTTEAITGLYRILKESEDEDNH